MAVETHAYRRRIEQGTKDRLQYSNSIDIDSIDSIDSMGKTEKYSVHKRLVYRTKETRSSNVRDTRSEESLAIINYFETKQLLEGVGYAVSGHVLRIIPNLSFFLRTVRSNLEPHLRTLLYCLYCTDKL